MFGQFQTYPLRETQYSTLCAYQTYRLLLNSEVKRTKYDVQDPWLFSQVTYK